MERHRKRLRVNRIYLAAAATAALALADTPAPAADGVLTGQVLTGQVSSVEEGAMEGVLVSAQQEGSTIRTTVVTDAQGHYAFPSGRLTPGSYKITIRAV